MDCQACGDLINFNVNITSTDPALHVEHSVTTVFANILNYAISSNIVYI